ncbi:MAG: PAS domain S-box protein [Promethearchaeota archaeon]
MSHKDKNLLEIERNFKLIMSNSNDLISILNEQFEHILINESAYYAILGYKKEGIIGKRLREFVHPEQIPLAAKREYSLNIEIHDSIITKFEKEEIHDVISNLLMNAI